MKIANPIYDVIFKYLLEDNEIAKYFLSLILGIEVVSVEVQLCRKTLARFICDTNPSIKDARNNRIRKNVRCL